MPHFTTVFVNAAMTIAFTATLVSPRLRGLGHGERDGIDIRHTCERCHDINALGWQVLLHDLHRQQHCCEKAANFAAAVRLERILDDHFVTDGWLLCSCALALRRK